MANQVRAIADSDKVVVETIPGFESIPRSQRRSDLAVLVRVTAPPECTRRAGVDLVAALDISGSMAGERLKSMQQAMLFVIDQLGADDRLSIVAFSHEVQPLTKLCAMSDGRNRDEAKNAINKLVAGGGNDMVGALETATKILKEQGESNRVSRILFLSDGEDPSVFQHRINPDSPVPVETFGLSAGHNPNVMRYIADQTSGVYSFVNQDLDKITNAFAQSMGGLTSVVAMGVQISLNAGRDGVTISSIEPADGRYRPSIALDGRSGSMYIHDLYAGERKSFIVHLTVPEGGVKELLSVGGTYKDPASAANSSSPVEINGSKAAVPRPWFSTTPWRRERNSAAAAADVRRPEVAAELVRLRLVKAVSDTAQAQQPGRLQSLWDEIRSSEDGRRAPAEDMSALDEDVALMQGQREGAPFMLSWLTSHLSQRATFKGSASGAGAFQTPAMAGMILVADPAAAVEQKPPPVVYRRKPDETVVGVFGRAKILYDHVINRARANPCSCAALLLLLAVAFLVALRGTAPDENGAVVVVMDNNNEHPQQEDGNSNTTVNSASIVLELSQHQGWLKVEKSLEVMVLNKMEDAGISAASFFHGASAEVMSQATNRYLLLALMHATILGSRCASVPSAEGVISQLEQKVETLEAGKMELGAKMELLAKEMEEAATNRAAASAACKDNDEALERASTRIAELERQLQDKKAFADSLLAEVANADAHLKTCGQRVDMLEAKLRESEEGPVVEA